MKKPETIQEFREYVEKKVKEGIKEQSHIKLALSVALDYFMLMTINHSGFSGYLLIGNNFGTQQLHCRGIHTSYEIRVEYREKSEYHFWINDYRPNSDRTVFSETEHPVSGHTFDIDFDIFWKKLVNLMCMVFNTEMIFPEIKILNNNRDWIEYR